MNSVLNEVYARREMTGRSGKTLPLFPTAIGWHKGVSLYKWIRSTRPRNTLEIGFASGASTLFICQALQDNGAGRHCVIDPLQTSVWDSAGLDSIERAGLSQRLIFHEAPAHVQLPRLVEQKAAVDFAFVDGQHLFDYALLDCFYIDLLLPIGGVLALDDPWMPSVRKVARFMLTNRGYRLVNYTNRLLAGAPAPAAVRAMIRCLLGWRGDRIAQPVFRFESLLYLQKMGTDNRRWRWHKDF